MNKAIIALLECPKTKKALEPHGDNELVAGHNSDDRYPFVGGIPWVYRYPSSQLLQWKAKAHHVISHFTANHVKLKKELESNQSLLAATRTRLEILSKGNSFNQEQFQEVLGPLLESGNSESIVHYAIGDKLPAQQSVSSYYDNVFRDWAWDNQENQTCLDIVKSLWPEDLNSETPFVVLGAGSGRLGADLHNELKLKSTLLVDINPFLLLTAKRIIDGESIELYEFPLNPVQSINYAVKQTCKSPFGELSGVDYLFADALHLPFKAKSLELVLTPWFIDIVSDDFRDFAKRLNRVLAKGATWINFGPLGFEHSADTKCYSSEEIVEILEESGFEVEAQNIDQIPYLQSPVGGHGRLEKTFSFRARKVKDAKEPKAFESVPGWLRDFNKPIPTEQIVADLRLRNQIHSEVLGTIDGKRTFSEIALLMTKHYGMTGEQANESLYSLLWRVYESSLRKIR